MGSFTPSGVEFVAKGLNSYLGDLAKADKAQQNLGKSASSIGGHFATAKSGVASFSQAVGSSSSTLGSFVSSLGSMATVAGGIVTAQIFNKIAEGVGAFASAGLEAVSHSQLLEASLGALLTQNNLYAQTTETMSVAVGNLAEMQTEAAKKSDDLAFKQRELTAEINTQNASIQEQRQRIIQMADGLDKNQQVARLQEMEIALEGMQRELAETTTEQGKLNTLTQEYETVTKTSWKQVMNMTDAQKLAKEQTADLLGFVEKLAIVSPFEQEDVEKVTQYAVGAGLGVDATKDFTSAFLDWSAAVGISSANLDEAAYQLLQVKKAGIITAVDLRQLTTRGLDLAKVIGVEMGMSVDEFNAKAKTTPAIFDDLIQAVVRYSNNTFAGTSQAMSTSLEGFRSTLSDLFTQSAKKIFRPLVDAATPAISEIIGNLTNFVTGGGAEQIGQQLADFLVSGFGRVQESITKIMGAFEKFGVRGAGVSLLGILGFSQEQVSIAMGVVDQIIGAVTRIQTAFETFGARGAAFSIMGLLGLDSDTMVTINNTIDTIISTLTTFGTQVASVLGQISFNEILGGLAGIAAVLAGGVIMGLVTGLMALLTPVNLLIAGAALLGAAWAGNWGNIQEKTGAVVAYVTEQINALITVLTPAFNSIWESLTKLSEAFTGAGVSSDTLAVALQSIGTFIIGTAIPAFVQLVGILAGSLADAIKVTTDGMIAGHNAWVALTGFIQSDVVPAFIAVDSALRPLQDLFVSFNELGLAVVAKSSQALAGLWQNVLWPALQKVGNFLKDSLMPSFTEIGQTVKGDVSPALKDFGENVLPLLNEGLEFIIEAIKDVIAYFDSLKATVNSFTLPDILTPGSPPPMAYALMDIASGADMAADAIKGMQKSLITSESNALRFIDDLNMGGIAKGAGAGGGQWRNFRNILKHEIMAGMGALADGTANVMDSVMQVAARFKFPPQMAAEFAKANGLIEHLTGSMTTFKKQINIENLGNLTQMAGSFSSLGSTFADMLTTQMGSSDEANKTVEAYQKLTAEAGTQSSQLAILQQELIKLTTSEGSNQIAIDKKRLAIEKATESVDFGQRQLEIYRQELAILMQDEVGNALKIEKKTLQIDRQVEAIDAQNKQLVTLQQELEKLTATNELDTASIEKKRLEIEKLTGEMAKNQQAVITARKDFEALATGPLADRIAFLDAFLESGQDSIRIIGEELGGIFAGTGQTADVFWDRVSAQDELNRLLEEQARQEELITAQKEAQQKLDFLKSQLDLIKLGQQLGGNIFQGMKFGLDASVEDLLAATNNIVMAMVDQINNDLQLGSPSRLMIKTFENVMAGAAIGVDKGSRALEYAFSASVSPFLNMGQRTASPLASTYNNSTTNNFDMKVYTGANPAAVIRQYEVARSMV